MTQSYAEKNYSTRLCATLRLTLRLTLRDSAVNSASLSASLVKPELTAPFQAESRPETPAERNFGKLPMLINGQLRVSEVNEKITVE